MFDTSRARRVCDAALTSAPDASSLAALAQLCREPVDAELQVDLLVALDRHAAWLSSLMAPLLAAAGDHAEAVARSQRSPGDPSDLPLRAAHAEIAVALRLSEVAASRQLEVARQLGGRLVMVADALANGAISYRHATAIVDATELLNDQQAAKIASRVLTRAGQQTVAELRRRLRRAVLAADPTQARKRAQRAHAERRLDWWALEDGMAELRLIAPAAAVLGVYTAADQLARRRGAGLTPSDCGWEPLDARRSDALADLVNAAIRSDADTPSAIWPRTAVHITMDLPTALGLRDTPAHLAGYGPLPAELARALAADGSWRRLIHEPLTGALLDQGHASYLPSAALTRFIQNRDHTCRFPGCHRPATRCDLDHTIRYNASSPDGGRTDRHNLGALCRHHHRLKHRGGWKLQRDPASAAATWTSPTGHHYTVAAHDHRPEAGPSPDEVLAAAA